MKIRKMMDLPEEVIKKVELLYPGAKIIYYAKYSDGCIQIKLDNGGEINEGKNHSPHSKFFPDDKPVQEWK